MRDMNTLNNDTVVREQYKTDDNLTRRISIHEKYSVNKLGFGSWIYSHYDFPNGGEILEVGCGNGEIWKNRLPLPESGIRLMLTDFSDGMVAASRNSLGERQNVTYQTADVSSLPYDSCRFDAVIANMMLYHVPDIERALGEIRRVLKNGGAFYCATYGENGIVPYVSELVSRKTGRKNRDTLNKNFTLQNGGDILKKHFSEVKRHDYPDALEVTDIGDLIDYLRSLSGIAFAAELDRSKLDEILSENMSGGILRVPKEYGMFVCRKQASE